MGYKLYCEDNSELVQKDLQNKMEWCRKGELLEDSFIGHYGSELGLIINPKKTIDPTVADFIHLPTNKPADLKTQNTPFFLSSRYNLDPQYAVTFNKIDLDRYQSLYPNILIYYSVHWMVTKIVFDNGRTTEVQPMSGLWGINLKNLMKLCTEKNHHIYQQRIGDKQGNALSSYVVNLKSEGFKEIFRDK